MAGVALIHITPSIVSISQGQQLLEEQIRSAADNRESLEEVTGLAAVFSACLISGFAGVFFEKLLKESSQPSVVVR